MSELFHVRWEHDVTVVSCQGPIVFGSAAADLSTNLRNLMEPGRRVVLDLSGVSRLDSYGIGVLFGIFSASLTNGATLVLSGVSDTVRRMLDQASLSSLMKVYGTDAEARNALSARPPVLQHH